VDFRLNLDSERIANIQSSGPTCLEPSTPVRQALRLMREHRRGAVLVCTDGVLTGIFTERDALRLLASTNPQLDNPIAERMTSDPVALTPDDTVAQAITKMATGGYRHLPVVDAQRRPQGFVSVAAILHYLVDHFPAVVYNLPPKPKHLMNEREGA
jgi:CBS domain-containing protein